MKSPLFSLLFLGALAVGCNGDDERYEDIKKLRALGVAALPAAPGSTAALTFYAAVPVGTDVTGVEAFVDDAAKYAAAPAMPVLDMNSAGYDEHAALRIYHVNATLPVPAADALPIAADPGFARLRYGVKIVAGDEEEKIVGNVLVYPAGSASLAWQAPTLAVAAPLPGATVSGKHEDLKATLDNKNGETTRIGWFASGGKIKSRRAKETEWETPGAGAATVIVTARGAKSGTFSVSAQDVTVQ